MRHILPLLLIVGIVAVSGCVGSNTAQTVHNSTVLLETTMGNITIELFSSEMPITSGNFENLTRNGFYDGVLFHRVISGFMIQGGDPLTKDATMRDYWGTGGPGYSIKDEFTKSNRNDRATISMANAGPNTGGSQFFINTADNGFFLDTKHPVFGRVIAGMDVVDAISNVQTDMEDRPAVDVKITRASVVS